MSLTKVYNRMIEGSEANVKDFGATGDGTTDDTLAIQAVLDSGYLCVFFPEGRYKITSTLTISNSFQTLRGCGVNTHIDAYTDPMTCFLVQANNVSIDGFHFVAFANTGTNDIIGIDNSGSSFGLSMRVNNIFTSQIGTGIKIGKECLISNITLEFFRQAGIHVVSGQYVNVVNFYLHRGKEGILIDGVSFASGVACNFSNGHIQGIEDTYADGSATNAIRVKESRKCNFSNILIQNTDEHAIYLEGNATTITRNCNFSNITFADIGYNSTNTKDCFLIEYSNDIGITNCVNDDGSPTCRYGVNADTNSNQIYLTGQKLVNAATSFTAGSAGGNGAFIIDNMSYLASFVAKTDLATTQDVDGYTFIKCFDSSATNFTGFTGGFIGQQVVMRFGNASTTLVDSSSFYLGGSNITPTANSAYTFIKHNTTQWVLVV